ncbi:caspase-8-like [Trichogramma pretiosum]|uniref:caspase-8-like n=1 Tax=Trichogramma pretiosum TaxID=7493 RepID=UPI0006C9DEDC|nr:caspase-8-like [Trichogramma pretiosum]
MELSATGKQLTSRELLIPATFPNRETVTQVLEEIARDLTGRDIISIMFLMSDGETPFYVERIVSTPTEAFLQVRKIKNWEIKLIESLFLTDNIKVLRKLGFQDVKISTKNYDGKNYFMPHLDRDVQRLYFYCESLEFHETKYLIQELKNSTDCSFECGREQQLELCFLNFLEDQKKNDTGSHDMYVLMRILNKIGYKTSCFNSLIENINETDNATSVTTKLVSSNDINFKAPDQNNILHKKKAPWSNNDKRICIIVNIEEFDKHKEKIKPRHGSDIDVENLEESFKGCGFEIEKHSNLNHWAMLELLQDMPHRYKNYGAIFLCIMSHGTKGHVSFTNQDLPLEKIEKEFCQNELRNVFKFIILQACQGTYKGLISKELIETDGIDNGMSAYNPKLKLNYSILQATIEGFQAFRSKTEGSILIQAVCKELEESTPIKVSEWAKLVKQNVSTWDAPSEHESYNYCQVPTYKDNTCYDYIIPKYQKAKRTGT